MSSSGYTETVDLSMNRIYAGNLDPRIKSLEDFDTAQSVINNSVIRTNTKSLQTLTAATSNDNKTGLSVLFSSISFGSDAIADGSRDSQVAGITFRDGTRMTTLSDATGQTGAQGAGGTAGAQGAAGAQGDTAAAGAQGNA